MFERLIHRTALFAIGFCMALGLAGAQQSERERETTRVWSQSLATILGKLTEAYENEDYAGVRAAANDILSRRGISNFDKASAYNILAGLDAQDGNYAEAIKKYETALGLEKGLNASEYDQSLFTVGSLYLVEGDYTQAIRYYERWLAVTPNPAGNQHANIASAYAQAGQFRKAVEQIELAIQKTDPPVKNQHQTALFLYSELNLRDKKLALLEKMVTLWPGEKNFWNSLRGEYSERNQERRAFNVFLLAYKLGLVDEESQIRYIAQRHDEYGDPLRGAQIMDREMRAGNVDRTVDNLMLLATLYQNAREADKALPLLKEAAPRAKDGEIFLRITQNYAQLEDWENVKENARAALNKGGLSKSQRAEVLQFLATSQYELGDAEAALETFADAMEIDDEQIRRRAQQWSEYIIAQEDARRRRIEQAWTFEKEELTAELIRCRETKESIEIFGDKFEEVDPELAARCAEVPAKLAAHEEKSPFRTAEGEGAGEEPAADASGGR